jgi:hypothetical protein
MMGQQIPHTVREIIHHEVNQLHQKCECKNVPYLWDCLGVLYSSAFKERQEPCSDDDMAKLKRVINKESDDGRNFFSSLGAMASADGIKNYGLLENFISGWVERMSDMIIHVLKDSMHRNDLGLHHPPGNKHVDALKKILFQKFVRGSPSRWEYTIFPGTDSHMRLGGFFKQWDPATVASAMFDHENKPFSGEIHEKHFYSKKGAKNSPPAAIFILSQIFLWSRFCEEDHSHLMKLF